MWRRVQGTDAEISGESAQSSQAPARPWPNIPVQRRRALYAREQRLLDGIVRVRHPRQAHRQLPQPHHVLPQVALAETGWGRIHALFTPRRGHPFGKIEQPEAAAGAPGTIPG
jgi:hypothetical protein